ncbi:MAG: SURF1 family protein [Pseudomonadota bacterium]|nr:SURF1 family protein [Pseudomonadota bacterium]
MSRPECGDRVALRPAPAVGTDGARPTRRRVVPLLFAACAFAVFCALGVWQVQRLFWKHALIAQVTQRVAATAVPAPDLPQWRRMAPDTQAYRHLTVAGRLLAEAIIPVQAVTQYGSGYWIISPLLRDDGSAVLVNRGFIAAPLGALPHFSAATPAATSDPSPVTITGLVRLSEPKGAFLRNNDAQNGRWYARDVAAMAAALGVTDVAPYFIDADAASSARLPPIDKAGTLPIGGLTVIAFADNHLVYALTWFALAAMVAGYATWFALGARRALRAA